MKDMENLKRIGYQFGQSEESQEKEKEEVKIIIKNFVTLTKAACFIIATMAGKFVASKFLKM